MNQLSGAAASACLLEMGLGPLWFASPAGQEQELGPGEAALTASELPAQPLAESAVNDESKSGPLPESAFESEPGTVAGELAPAARSSALEAGAADIGQSDGTAGMSWAELERTVEQCRQCGLCAGRRQTVFGTGDRQGRWLFVGEGPGYHENQQGQPFVGPAGKLLDNMLKALGVARGEQAYIANVVKCRPTDANGKDRPPTEQEIAACLPYLHRQIALQQPKVIVALGKTAAIALLGLPSDTPVSQLRGKLHQINGVPLIVTYHPAYLLRQPADKARAWRDLCLAQSSLS